MPCSTFRTGRSSARVAPRLTTTTGTPRCAAAADEPEARHHRQRGAEHQQRVVVRVQGVHRRVAALDPRLGDVLAEEHHVRLEHSAAGRRSPAPRSRRCRRGRRRRRGGPRRRRAARPSPGSAPPSRACSESRPVSARQPRQTTSAIRPCSAHTAREPAASCRPSTFWVISSRSRPAASSAARARWPALGSARLIRDQPRCERAQYRCWAAGPETNSRVGHRHPGGRARARGSPGCRSRCSSRPRSAPRRAGPPAGRAPPRSGAGAGVGRACGHRRPVVRSPGPSGRMTVMTACRRHPPRRATRPRLAVRHGRRPRPRGGADPGRRGLRRAAHRDRPAVPAADEQLDLHPARPQGPAAPVRDRRTRGRDLDQRAGHRPVPRRPAARRARRTSSARRA